MDGAPGVPQSLMKYMFLIYSDESIPLSSHDLAEITAGHTAVMADARAKGKLVAAEPLRSSRHATTVRKGIVTDGPFAEAKEQLAGYYILDVESQEEAIEWAHRIPTGCKGGPGAVEIRPLPGLPKAMA